MVFLSKQKFNVQELAEVIKPKRNVLLIMGEEPLGEVYRRHLNDHDFVVDVYDFAEVVEIARRLNSASLLVMELRHDAGNRQLEFLKAVKRDFPNISVITVGQAIEDEILSKLMDLGVIGHLDRRFSRPQDLVVLAKTTIIPNQTFNI